MPLAEDHKEKTRYVLCVHIGATSLHVAIVDSTGTILDKEQHFAPPQKRRALDYRELLNEAIEALALVVRRSISRGLDPKEIAGGAGIVPGSVTPQTGYVSLLPALPGLRNSYLARDLTRALRDVVGRQVDFWVENDANARGLWELRFGYGQNIESFFVVLLCTGLGGALILNHALYHGHTYRAGEIGHTTVLPDGPFCACGGKGCLETMASGGALLKSIDRSSSPLHSQRELSYQQIIQAAQDGDQEVVAIFHRMGHYLGIGLANIVNTINPARLIVCGQLNPASEFFLSGVKEEMENRAFQGTDCELVISDQIEDMEVKAAFATFANYSKWG